MAIATLGATAAVCVLAVMAIAGGIRALGVGVLLLLLGFVLGANAGQDDWPDKV